MVFNHVRYNTLKDISFTLYSGDILGLISLDHVGLSALLHTFLYPVTLDSGFIAVRGDKVSTVLEHSKQENKVSLLEFKTKLVSSLSLAENFFSLKKNGPKILSFKTMRREFQRIVEPYNLALTGDEYPSDITNLERCKIEILKAKAFGIRSFILNDPSSFLGPSELYELNSFVKRLAKEDMSFIYLGGHHEELLEVCTKLMLLKEGLIIYFENADKVQKGSIDNIAYEFTETEKKLHIPYNITQEPDFWLETKGINIPLHKGDCNVFIDLDNKMDFFSGDNNLQLGIKLFSNGEELDLLNSKVAIIPRNAIRTSLYYDLSYFDNLTLRASCKIPFFYSKRYFRNSVVKEYKQKLGELILAKDLYSLTDEELLDLVYNKVGMEMPKVLLIFQPFAGFDMYQRMSVLDHISTLRRKGVSILIIALSVSDVLSIASKLFIFKGGKLERQIEESEFPEIRRNRKILDRKSVV